MTPDGVWAKPLKPGLAQSSKGLLKVHVNISDYNDLRRVQEELIPFLDKNNINSYKTMSLVKNEAELSQVFKNSGGLLGQGQGRKGFTFYSESPEDAVSLGIMIDDFLMNRSKVLKNQF
jgi:hypothetical protein